MIEAKDKLCIIKTVRLPQRIYDRLFDEAQIKSIKMPAVLARMLLVERLKKDITPLIELAKKRPHISMTEPKINLTLSQAIMDQVEEAIKKMSKGSFTAVIQAVLIERYDNQLERFRVVD